MRRTKAVTKKVTKKASKPYTVAQMTTKPTAPKQPDNLKPKEIGESWVRTYFPQALAEARSKIDNEILTKCECGYCYDNEDGCETIALLEDRDLCADSLIKLSEIMRSMENALPGIEGTKSVSFNTYDPRLVYTAMMYPSLEEVAANNKRYESQLEKYEELKAIYNSEQAVAYRKKVAEGKKKKLEAKLKKEQDALARKMEQLKELEKELGKSV